MKKSRERNKKFATFRKAEGTQQEMAEFLSKALKANINQGNVGAVERGERSVPDTWIQALHIHKLLNYDWFYGNDRKMKIVGHKEKPTVTDIAEMKETIELLKIKIKAQEKAIDKLWENAYPDEN
jgi:hypothetical protein